MTLITIVIKIQPVGDFSPIIFSLIFNESCCDIQHYTKTAVSKGKMRTSITKELTKHHSYYIDLHN